MSLEDILDIAEELTDAGIEAVTGDEAEQKVLAAGAGAAAAWARYLLSKGRDPHAELDAMLTSVDVEVRADFEKKFGSGESGE